MKIPLASLSLLLSLTANPAVFAQDIDATLEERLAELPPHPRLFLNDEELGALRTRHEHDVTLQRYVRDALAVADSCLQADALTHELRGPRLLHVSRECLRRIQALALAYRWTARQEFAERATQDLLAVCAFSDWNPSHFLDVAEMTHAVALGYDWLFDAFDEDDRERIAVGLREHGLVPGAGAYEGAGAWWTRSAFNWNQVCNAGLVIGALALADEEAVLARRIMSSALHSLPVALASYDPDGAWMEGPGYWGYATRYTAYGLDALRSALGTDLDLGDRAGLRAAGWFPIYTTGPTGYFFNFADVSTNARRGPSPCLFWLARRYDEPAFAAFEHQLLEHQQAKPWHVVWYRAADDPPPALASVRLFGGRVPVAVFRSGEDRDALFVATKGGYNQVNHGHLDLGTFVIDALGVRWAHDLGADDYNLPGYWHGGRDGQRWTYFRLNSRSHNVPLIDGAGQDPLAVAEVESFSRESAHIVLDLGDAYAPKVKRARRGLRMVGGRSVLVQDEFELAEPCTVTWGLTTYARASVGDEGTVTLTRDGKDVVLQALAPADATWAVSSAERESPERDNRNVQRVELRVRAATGSLRIAVQLRPVWPAGAATGTEVESLDAWQ